ncbi:MAG: hypothetical protein IPK31_06680 [Chitinophagaceae bacterium]|nr:hypothetical protein [Chitinophagaceae bacterium]
MAKTIILAALIFVSISGYTQLVQQDSTIAKATPVDYLKMSKKQKTGGFILLTTSVVSGIAGLGILAKEGGNLFNDGRNTGACILGGCSNTPEESYNDGKARGGLVLLGIGAASLVSSIVLFTKSSKSKRKAMNVSYHFKKAPIMQPGGGVAIKPMPVVTFTLSL